MKMLTYTFVHFNRIIAALTAETLGLFQEHIRSLDKKIQPGLSKMLWSSKGATSLFISDCRLHANKVSIHLPITTPNCPHHIDKQQLDNLRFKNKCFIFQELHMNLWLSIYVSMFRCY